MDVSDLVSPQAIVPQLRVAGKKQLLQELANRIAPMSGLAPRVVFEALLERERLGATGVGSGIAIPHAKLAGLDRIYGLFARLSEPVDFDAIDDQPVDLVFLLIVPEAAGADHLKALARISRLLRNQQTCEKLRAAEDASAIYALLTEAQASQAA